MNADHLEDDAELYVLGAIPEQRVVIERHLRVCAACTERVRVAEAAAAALAAALPLAPAAVVPLARPTARTWWPLATAAAVVLAVGGLAVTHERATDGQLARTDTALIAMAGAHFNHVTLAGRPGVIAKAIYARDGAWCYIVADGVPSGAHVVLTESGASHDLGVLEGQHPATLFVRAPGRAAEFAIVADGSVEARGIPQY